MVVLDTDHVSLLDRVPAEASRRLQSRLDALPPDEVVVTIISFEEQTRGWMAYLAKARTVADQVEAYRRLRRHLHNYSRMSVIEFDEPAATRYQQLRARVRIGSMDLKIAAIVLSRGATLLSRNLADFGKVPGLKVEDWSA